MQYTNIVTNSPPGPPPPKKKTVLQIEDEQEQQELSVVQVNEGKFLNSNYNYYTVLMPLNMIVLGQTKNDNINQMITITDKSYSHLL
jgi:hypothetical protein